MEFKMEFKQVLLFLVIPTIFLMFFQFIFFTYTFKSLDEFLNSQFFWSLITTFGISLYILILRRPHQGKETHQGEDDGKSSEQINEMWEQINQIGKEEENGIVRRTRFESAISLCRTLITVEGIFLSILGTGYFLIKAPNLPLLLAFLMLTFSMVVGLMANDRLSVVADIDNQRLLVPRWMEFWIELSYQYHLFISGMIYLFLGVIFHLLS
jgi:hypothetical protein